MCHFTGCIFLIKKQWYEENPEMLAAERNAMSDLMGDKVEFIVLSNGAAGWKIHYCPELLDKSTRKGEKCDREYDIAILYEDSFPDTPKEESGTRIFSSKAFFLRPSIDELQMIVKERYPYNYRIPHLLRSDMGDLYPVLRHSYIETIYKVDFENASAVETAKMTFNWIATFETGIEEPHIWELFTRLGPGI